MLVKRLYLEPNEYLWNPLIQFDYIQPLQPLWVLLEILARKQAISLWIRMHVFEFNWASLLGLPWQSTIDGWFKQQQFIFS